MLQQDFMGRGSGGRGQPTVRWNGCQVLLGHERCTHDMCGCASREAAPPHSDVLWLHWSGHRMCHNGAARGQHRGEHHHRLLRQRRLAYPLPAATLSLEGAMAVAEGLAGLCKPSRWRVVPLLLWVAALVHDHVIELPPGDVLRSGVCLDRAGRHRTCPRAALA